MLPLRGYPTPQDHLSLHEHPPPAPKHYKTTMGKNVALGVTMGQ